MKLYEAPTKAITAKLLEKDGVQGILDEIKAQSFRTDLAKVIFDDPTLLDLIDPASGAPRTGVSQDDVRDALMRNKQARELFFAPAGTISVSNPIQMKLCVKLLRAVLRFENCTDAIRDLFAKEDTDSAWEDVDLEEVREAVERFRKRL